MESNLDRPAFTPERRSSDREKLREEYFDQLVAKEILDNFELELEDAGMTPDQIRKIAIAFAALPEEDKRAALAYPAALRPKLFSRYAERMRSGEVTPTGMVAELRDHAKAESYVIGFHLSNADIKPQQEEWNVRGTEKDHRNNDLPMAYYSTDYSNRYRKKPAQYLYVIRACTKIDPEKPTGHYPDNDGTWGRAYSLPIIAQIDMLDIEEQLDARMREHRKDNAAEPE